MRDDLIARLKERAGELDEFPFDAYQDTASMLREAIAALTAQGETAPAPGDEEPWRCVCGHGWVYHDANDLHPCLICQSKCLSFRAFAAASSLPAAEGLDKPVCANPADCCRELSRVWVALGVSGYTGESASENVTALRAVAEGRR